MLSYVKLSELVFPLVDLITSTCSASDEKSITSPLILIGVWCTVVVLSLGVIQLGFVSTEVYMVVFTISKSNVKYVEQNVDVIGEEYHVICLANTSDNKILAKIHTLLRFLYPFQKIIIIGLVVIT